MDRIERLAVFLRVADCGSFTQAADQLGLPRASVSAAVQQLEARLGTRLLHRTTRRVSLSPDGEALLERARTLVGDLEELEQQFQPASALPAGRLRVDLPSRIARRMVAPALPEFMARHPQIEVELGSGDRTVDLVQEGIDCALRVGPLSASSLVARPLGAFHLVHCASPAYLQRHAPLHTPADLPGHQAVRYASPSSGRIARWEWSVDGAPHSCELPGAVLTHNAETYIACCLAGLGLIQIPAFDVRDHLEAGELVEVLPDFRPAPMPVHLVYPHRRYLSLRTRAFADWLENLLRPHMGALAPAG